MFKMNEVTKDYTTTRPVTADEIVATALDILAVRLPHTDALTNPEAVKNYLATQFAGLEHEIFACLLLDTTGTVLSGMRRCFEGQLMVVASIHVKS